MDDIGGFVKQVPIGLLIAPLFFGGLYVILMFIIFRRAAERRRKRREGQPPMQDQRSPSLVFATPMPATQTASADWSIPPSLRSIPEPDLDALATPSLMTEPETVESAALAPSTEWLAMMAAPVQAEENTMPMSMPNPVSDAGKSADASTAPSDAVELLRVWRDLSDGSLIIQMGEQRYRSMAEIGSPDLTRRFTGVVRELWNMVNGGAMNSARVSATLAAVEAAAVLPSPDGSAGSMSARIGMLNAPQTPDEAAKAKSGMLRNLARTAMGQPTTAKPPEKRNDGIADAVEEYLQYKLSSHPEFQSRSIHVRPAVDGGVRIDVDGHFYDGVGDVIDADVRDFLFSVLKEWEARQ